MERSKLLLRVLDGNFILEDCLRSSEPRARRSGIA